MSLIALMYVCIYGDDMRYLSSLTTRVMSMCTGNLNIQRKGFRINFENKGFWGFEYCFIIFQMWNCDFRHIYEVNKTVIRGASPILIGQTDGKCTEIPSFICFTVESNKTTLQLLSSSAQPISSVYAVLLLTDSYTFRCFQFYKCQYSSIWYVFCFIYLESGFVCIGNRSNFTEARREIKH